MKEVIETTLTGEIIVWTDSDGDHDVTHTPKLGEISLSESDWKIGQKVRVTIESIADPLCSFQYRRIPNGLILCNLVEDVCSHIHPAACTRYKKQISEGSSPQ
jgi:hypothetical protein